MPMRNKKITKSSQGAACTLNIAGICNYNPETTVYCHLPDGNGGMGMKSTDLSGCDGCSSCHDVLDGRVKSEEFEQNKEFYMRRANVRTLERLFSEGVLKVA